MGWINMDETRDGSMGPILRGEDRDGRRVELLEHPLNTLDPAQFNFLVLREAPDGGLTEHFTFSIPRDHAELFFFRTLTLVEKRNPTLIEDFCAMFAKTSLEDEQKPKDS